MSGDSTRREETIFLPMVPENQTSLWQPGLDPLLVLHTLLGAGRPRGSQCRQRRSVWPATQEMQIPGQRDTTALARVTNSQAPGVDRLETSRPVCGADRKQWAMGWGCSSVVLAPASQMHGPEFDLSTPKTNKQTKTKEEIVGKDGREVRRRPL